MFLTEILPDLLKGKYAARHKWKETGEYVVLLPGMQYIWKILTQPNPNAGNWLPLVEDLQADDWSLTGGQIITEAPVSDPA